MLGTQTSWQKPARDNSVTITTAHSTTDETNSNSQSPLLDIRDLKVHFPVTEGFIIQRQVGVVKAVDGVNLSVNPGETLGLVGESGSGKTTVGRAILKLEEATAGQIILNGEEISDWKGTRLREARRHLGMVFQDPFGSLNPRMSAGNLVGEPLKIHGLTNSKSEYRRRVAELLSLVGLNPQMAGRYPHEFSGGQRQRLGVARALASKPDVMVLDEPVSALDVSIQAQVINLIKDLQTEFGLAYIFIAHDLSVVRNISDRVAVMYLGKIVETGARDELYNNPKHPYTQALLSAVPTANPVLERTRNRIVLEGDIPSPLNPPSGCVFRTRCPVATEECSQILPELQNIEGTHSAACINGDWYKRTPQTTGADSASSAP
jgi:oligopeptide transport system ATP-binding protein